MSSIFQAFKKELEANAAPKDPAPKKKSRPPKRESHIDTDALESLKGRLSILNDDTVSSLHHDNITTVSPNDHDTVSLKDHQNITLASPKGHDNDAVMVIHKNNDKCITKVSVSVSSHHQDNEYCIIELTEIQAKVYNWFLSNGMEGHYNKWSLSKQTGIIHCTLRRVMRKLESSELIFIRGYNPSTKHFSYQINNKKTAKSVSPKYQYQYHDTKISVSPNDHDTLNNSSSSSLNIKTTTAEFFEHPESEFWIKAGVTPEMFEKNIEKHGIDPNVFIRSAKHYAFEYSQPGKTSPDTNHLTHLIGGIRQFSEWVKINGYVSFEERQKRLSESIASESMRRFEEWNKAKRERAFSEWLVKYMETPESEEVKSVLDKANPIQKRSIEKGADSAMMTLRALWEKE